MGMDEERWKKWESPFRQPVSRRALVRGAALTSAALRLGGFGLSARAAQAEPGPAPLTGTAPVLIRNAALVITMDPTLGEGPLGIISNGDVLFRGETLVAAGRGLSAPGATVLDASGKIVLPGFVDGHTHLVQSIYRGGCADQDLLGWLTNCKRPVSDALTPPDVYAAVRLSTLDTISTGVTTVVDWAGAWRPELAREYIRALADSGLRFVFAFAQPRQSADGIKRIKEELIDPNPRATLQVTGLPGIQNLELPRAATAIRPSFERPGSARFGSSLGGRGWHEPDRRGDRPAQARAHHDGARCPAPARPPAGGRVSSPPVRAQGRRAAAPGSDRGNPRHQRAPDRRARPRGSTGHSHGRPRPLPRALSGPAEPSGSRVRHHR
jgi:hypothetical protein